MMSKYKKLLHDGFEVSILLKGLNGALESIGGILFLILGPMAIGQGLLFFLREELRVYRGGLFFSLLFRWAGDLAISGRIFAGLFLLSHGVIKLFLILALFKKKLWAYPLAI